MKYTKPLFALLIFATPLFALLSQAPVPATVPTPWYVSEATPAISGAATYPISMPAGIGVPGNETIVKAGVVVDVSDLFTRSFDDTQRAALYYGSSLIASGISGSEGRSWSTAVRVVGDGATGFYLSVVTPGVGQFVLEMKGKYTP